MRVVHISKVTGIAGSEQHLLTLLPGLRERGIEPYMLTLTDPRQPPDRFFEALTERGIPFEAVPIHHHIDPTLSRRLRGHINRMQPDIVHTHLVHADFYGLTAAGSARCISSRHNDNAFRRNPLFGWLNRRVMQRADQVVAISNHITGFLAEVEGLPPTKVTTIRYGLDIGRAETLSREAAHASLSVEGDGPVIGFVGRLIEQKGVDILLQAFARLDHPRAQLMIVGDGPLRPELEAAAPAGVRFAGWVDDASRLMPAFDVLAVPSRWEGFGLVTLEAMYARLPIVASAVSALPEIIRDGETGYLAPAGDVMAFANALHSLLNTPTRIKQMGSAGHKRLLEHFTAQNMIDQTCALYTGDDK